MFIEIQPSLNIALLLNTISAIVILFFGYLVYTSIRKYNNESLILRNKYEELRNNQERIMLESELEVREQTFQYISKEIHDNILQTLSLAQLTLNCIDPEMKSSDDSLQQIKKVRELQSKTLTDLNSMSKTLDSDIIETHGLVVAIQLEIERWQKLFENKIILLIEGESIHLPKNAELFIFRIIQEAISNASRHSGARTLIIAVKYDTEQTSVTIEDNGKGFNLDTIYDHLDPTKMSGLKNMKKRTELLGGKFNIRTQPGLGTSISANIPTIQWKE